MAASPLHIDLSESQEAFIRQQSAARGFATPSEFIVWLIQQAKSDAEQSAIDALIVEGLVSQPKHEMNSEFRQRMHSDLDKREDLRRSA